MLQAKIKANVLKSIVDITSILIDEAKFHLTDTQLSLRAVDPAHVAMVDLSLEAKAFEEFSASEGDLGLDLDKLKEILKLAGSGDIVSLNHDEDANRLIVRVGNVERKMGLLDISSMNDPKIPNLNLPAKIVLKSSEIEQGIRAAESVADYIVLSADENSFELNAQGDSDAVNLKLTKDQVVSLDAKEAVKSMFSLSYIANMTRVSRVSEQMLISIGKDFPIKLEFDLADGNGHVTYLLAPRIESE